MKVQETRSLTIGTKLIMHYGDVGQFSVEVEVIGNPKPNGDVPVKILKGTARFGKNARYLAAAKQLRTLTAIDRAATLLHDIFM